MSNKQIYAIVVVIVIIAAVGAYYILNNDRGDSDSPMVDAAGNEIVIPENVESITAASPSIADIVCYMGYADKLVCVSNYCSNSLIPDDVTTCGSYSNPDTDAISTANATVTFIDGSGSNARNAYQTLKEAGMNVVLMYGSDDGAEGIYRNVEIMGYVNGDSSSADQIVSEMRSTMTALDSATSSASETTIIISTGLGSLSTDSSGNFTNLDAFDGSGVYLAGADSTLSTLTSQVSNCNNPISGSSWVSADTDLVSTSLGDVDLLIVLWTNQDSMPSDDAINDLLDKMKETAWANCGAVQSGNIVFIGGTVGSDLSRVTPYTIENGMPIMSLYVNSGCYSTEAGGAALSLSDLPHCVDDSNLSTLVGYTSNPVTSSADLQLIDEDINPVLEVYGNVNEDLVIDENDAILLQQALDNGTASQYRYADANFDGTVDEKDVSYIYSIIDATFENPVDVRHLNRYTEGDYYTVTSYPFDSIAISGSGNIILMLMYADVNEEIKALTYSSRIDSTLYADYQYLFSDYGRTFDVTQEYEYRVGASAGYFSEELLVNHINNDGISAIITADNANTYLAGSSSSHAYGIDEVRAEELGLDVVRVASASTDPESYLSDIALICFLMQKEVDVEGLTQWYEDVVTDINNTLRQHVGYDVDQVSVAASSACTYSQSSDGTIDSYNYISSDTSDYTAVLISAGGSFALDGYDFGTSSSSSKYEDLGQWLVDYGIDKLVIIRTGSGYSWYGGTALTDGVSTLTSYMMAFSDSEPFYNNEVYVLSGDMPILLRTVYAACILYPDLFDEEWAEEYNVQLCTEYLGLSEDTVRGGTYYVSMEDLGLSGH